METNHWLPLTEYAMRSGISVSTLRRKIKTNDVDYRMEEGRYLIRYSGPVEISAPMAYVSSDHAPNPTPAAMVKTVVAIAKETEEEIAQELQKLKSDSGLQWRALEARVAGLSRKIDLFGEQIAELKMLVKIFEEKLDANR